MGRDFLPRSSGIVTRRPLDVQLHRTEDGAQDYAEFLHMPNRRFTDFSLVRKEIQDETVANLTLIDLPGLTKVVVEGQSQSIAQDIENMVRSYVDKVLISLQLMHTFIYKSYGFEIFHLMCLQINDVLLSLSMFGAMTPIIMYLVWCVLK